MKDEQFENDLREVVDICRSIQDDMQGSAASFIPVPEDIVFYEELTKRGIMAKDPLDEKAYIFSDKYNRMYHHKDVFDREFIIQAEDILVHHQTDEEKENDHRAALDEEANR